jgi:hypothetical protein
VNWKYPKTTRAIEDIVIKNRSIAGNCPPGHRIDVRVIYKYVRVPTPTNVTILQEIRAKLVPSGQIFTDEDFEALLELPLSGRDRAFILFFEENKNKPLKWWEWKQRGFAEHVRYKSINAMCKRRGLWIKFGPIDNKSWGDARCCFMLMEESRPVLRQG